MSGSPRAGSPEAAAPVEALLAVAAHPDNDIASMCFNFWHRLSRELTSSFNAGAAEAPQVGLWSPGVLANPGFITGQCAASDLRGRPSYLHTTLKP